jgi:hypothetical protein
LSDEPVFPRRVLIGWIGAAVAMFAVALYFMGSQEVGGTDSSGPSTYRWKSFRPEACW